MNGDHLTVEGKTMICLHCGFKEQIKTPQRMDGFLSQLERFDFNHTDCKKPEPKKASDYLTTMSDYAKGFDHGCDYIIHEIEQRAIKVSNQDALVLTLLLKHLKG